MCFHLCSLQCSLQFTLTEFQCTYKPSQTNVLPVSGTRAPFDGLLSLLMQWRNVYNNEACSRKQSCVAKEQES